MRTWSRQLEDLTSQVAQLKMDKQELQQRNRILESSLTLNTHHEERLHCNEVPPAPSAPQECMQGTATHQQGWHACSKHILSTWWAFPNQKMAVATAL